MTDGFRPLPGERGVRFGCGALVGGLFGFYMAIRETEAGPLAIAIAAGLAIVFGFLAARYGDRFWESVGSVVRWW